MEFMMNAFKKGLLTIFKRNSWDLKSSLPKFNQHDSNLAFFLYYRKSLVSLKKYLFKTEKRNLIEQVPLLVLKTSCSGLPFVSILAT